LPIAVDLAVILAAVALPFGVGLALPTLLMGRSGTLAGGPERAQALALAGAAGVLVNYALGVTLTDLDPVLLICAAIAAASLCWAAAMPGFLRALVDLGPVRWIVAVGLLLLFAGPILLEPLAGWDARSIWFFQAKRIFHDGGLDIEKGWVNLSYGFSHLEYPKLLPLLGAQVAYGLGFWNEYLPKAGLLVLLAPVVLGLLGVARHLGYAFVLLLLVFLLGGGAYLWNGYADAYLAAYAGLAMLFFSRWLSRGAALDLACGLVFLGVTLNLKNEGTLVAVCVGAGLLLFAPAAVRMLTARRVPEAVWIALLLPLIGFGVWTATRIYWGGESDLQLGLGTVARIAARIGDGGLVVAGLAMLSQPGSTGAALALVFAAILAGKSGRRVPPEAWFPAVVAAMYALGIFAIYLGTPHDLRWHLATSAERTLLVAMCGFCGSAFLVLEAIEAPLVRPATQGMEEMRLQT
jgi:hypothetical protein